MVVDSRIFLTVNLLCLFRVVLVGCEMGFSLVLFFLYSHFS